MTTALLSLAGYLIGSVSFAWILVRGLKGIDLRTVGSGNLGATNAGRVLGKKGAILIYALDFTKALLPVIIAKEAFGEPLWRAALPGTAAVLGHIFPLWHRFRGGKGVASGSGVIAALNPLSFAIVLATFALTLALSRMVSAASVLAALIAPFAWWIAAPRSLDEGTHSGIFVGLAILSILVVWLHRNNLARIRAGTERRIGDKKS